MSNPGSDLPPFNYATSSFKPANASLDLNGSRLFYLPLPARMDRLQGLVDSYLNKYAGSSSREPTTNDWFGVAAPFVFLTLADYGSLSPEGASQGWFAYDEVLLAIPLAWYRRVSPEQPFTFHAWTTFSPIIYVSQPAAQWLGREVLGFVKTQATVETPASAWSNTGDGPYEMLTVHTQGFSEAFVGDTASRRCLIEVVRDSPSIIGRVPPDYSTMFNPFAAVPSAMVSGYQLMNDLFTSVYGNPSSGWPPGVPNPLDPWSYLRMMNPSTWPDSFDPVRLQNTVQLGWEISSGMRWDRSVGLINLKQFPEADDPLRYYDQRGACYSAIVNTPMTFRDIFAGGLLGASDIMRGQLNGGYRVQITSHDNQPIARMLGLEPVQTWRDDEGRRVDVIEPMLPTWIHGDLRLGPAENYRVQVPSAEPPRKVPYLNTLSQSRPGGVPPFVAAASTFRVLPLRADPTVLGEFIDRYLNSIGLPEGVSFEARGSFVYVVIADYSDMLSIPRPEGFLEIRELSFQVPVTYRDGDRVQYGWVCPFIFSDNDAWAITMRETYGFEMRLAEIESPPNSWLSTPVCPTEPRSLVKLYTDVLPALSIGAELQSELVAEVVEGIFEPSRGAKNTEERTAAIARHSAQPWNGIYKTTNTDTDKSERHGFALKQFRDAEQPERACYQAIVQSPVKLDVNEASERRSTDTDEESELYLKLWYFADLPIKNYLGLQPEYEEIGEGRPFYVFKACGPRAFDAEAEFKSGETLYFRSSRSGPDQGWQRGVQWLAQNPAQEPGIE